MLRKVNGVAAVGRREDLANVVAADARSDPTRPPPGYRVCRADSRTT
jgi:hypothetical protein